MIIIQHIETIWTKKSRGMPEAAKRNAVPRKMEVPVNVFNRDGLYIHKVTADESNNFILKPKLEILPGTSKYWTLNFVDMSSVYRVIFKYKYYSHGKPDRGNDKILLFNLKSGQTGTYHINGRLTSYSGQHYIQHFVNIGNMKTVDKGIFLDRKSDFFVDNKVDLF